ncbi:rhodanese-like domain-containing protein [Chamaesiphon sp. GL140_3_metabinner_50]|uniref:rhodanese-like domain-containing protein n=1 Tax=Chamaesiphon sp. GL140_3_metabinner_50 TaxID=2970812 RepID=UPI0025DC6E0D|nr:rhodanese-like domain-containing protein [Chamaesiphon sp. GL140_3_metabinner_50]
MTVPINPKLQAIDPPSLDRLLRDRQAILLDVREAGEYASEHITGSVSLPLSTFDPVAIDRQPDRQVVLYCQSGKRSVRAADRLFEAGWMEVIHLEGGLNAWKTSAYPTHSDERAPISLWRQVQIVAGSLVAIGTLCGVLVSPWFLLLSGFVGCGLVFAGISDTCAMGMLLAKLPYNQRAKVS